MSESINDLTREQKYFLAVGEIASRFSMLEQFLVFYIGIAANIPIPTCAALFGGEKFHPLIELFDAAVRMNLNDKNLLPDFEYMVGQMIHLAGERNHYVHSAWNAFENKPEEILASKFKKKELGQIVEWPQGKPIELEKLHELQINLVLCTTDLIAFMKQNFPYKLEYKNG